MTPYVASKVTFFSNEVPIKDGSSLPLKKRKTNTTTTKKKKLKNERKKQKPKKKKSEFFRHFFITFFSVHFVLKNLNHFKSILKPNEVFASIQQQVKACPEYSFPTIATVYL